MIILLWLIGLILGIAVLAYMRAGLLNSCIAVGVYLLAMTLFSSAHWLVYLVVWAIFLGIAIPLNMPDWRRATISKPLFKWFKTVLPPLSDTEQVQRPSELAQAA
jgi:acyl-CoA dehydrogenase